jgi:hypothetical protein
MQEVSVAGHDVIALVEELVNGATLGSSPARELRYRLIPWLNLGDLDHAGEVLDTRYSIGMRQKASSSTITLRRDPRR